MTNRLFVRVLLYSLVAVVAAGNCLARAQESRTSEVVASELAAAPALEAAAPAAQPAAQPALPAANFDSSNRFGIGVQVSTLGLGGLFAYRLTHSLNVRGGFNFMSISDTFTANRITYGAQLHFRSAQANLDWFFLGPLHLSPGALLYNGNGIKATVSVPTGQTFTLNDVQYESGTPPLGGSASLSLNKVAPEILFGVGNMIPRSGRHFAGQFEIGAIYEGSPNFVFSLTGNVCTPPNTSGPTCQSTSATSVQANVSAEQAKINHDAAPFKFFPIIAGGFSIAF